ncbi:tripartite tricarboxylate transporter TctB family protein [Streptococcus porcorum]|uniref:TcdA-E operon negative regulator n=1 Tax=Streptococcus porcorum TaxID=701526 RepID=A0ABV2JGK6_9STRE
MEYIFLLGFIGVIVATTLFIVFLVQKPRNKKKIWSSVGAMITLLFVMLIGLNDTNPDTETETTSETTYLSSEETKDYSDEDTTYEESSSSSSSYSSSSSSSSSSPSTSTSSSQPFDPNSYQTVDFNTWNHDDVKISEKIQLTGTVVQNTESDGDHILRVAINGDYDQIILAQIYSSTYNDVIAEDDTVTLYGFNMGLTSYETVFGATKTLPALLVNEYDVSY